LGGANNGTYTINLGTSGETQIILQGTGNHQITAASATVETFIMGATQNGGAKITGLQINDLLDTGSVINLAAAQANSGQVNAAGKYFANATTLTWWDSNAGHNFADTITFTLPAGNSLQLQADHHTFKVV
jgi:hypothetical protein